MAKAKLYGMPRKGIPNNRCLDKHWKSKQERNTNYGKPKQSKHFADGAGRNPGAC